MIDRKGITSFLAITFTITYAIEGALILSGYNLVGQPAIYGQLIIAGVMWVPALATFITIKFITHEGFAITNLRFGSWKPYLATAFIIPICFIIIYLLTWLLASGNPDWKLSEYMAMMEAAGADMAATQSPTAILGSLSLATLFFTPFINSLFGFGEEFGWRGYLLPKLMPLGKTRAYLLLGIIWGLWHAPLITIGFLSIDNPVLGILVMIGLTTTLGIYINELTLHYRSSILAGWVHGVFNSQSYGIWMLIFYSLNRLTGGHYGLVGLAVWLLLGLATVWYFKRNTPAENSSPASVK